MGCTDSNAERVIHTNFQNFVFAYLQITTIMIYILIYSKNISYISIFCMHFKLVMARLWSDF